MKCPECGQGTMKEGTTTVRAQVRGEEIPVSFHAAECRECGFQAIDAKELGAYGRAVADTYRRKHGLLTSEDIKKRRQEMGFRNQEEFAKYLRVGAASVKRWEAGMIQDEAMDHLMRLKTDQAMAESNLEEVRRRLAQCAKIDSARRQVIGKYHIQARSRCAPWRAATGIQTLRLAGASRGERRLRLSGQGWLESEAGMQLMSQRGIAATKQ